MKWFSTYYKSNSTSSQNKFLPNQTSKTRLTAQEKKLLVAIFSQYKAHKTQKIDFEYHEQNIQGKPELYQELQKQ